MNSPGYIRTEDCPRVARQPAPRCRREIPRDDGELR
jgi:hypothetical protein